jgi:hypothetical protein
MADFERPNYSSGKTTYVTNEGAVIECISKEIFDVAKEDTDFFLMSGKGEGKLEPTHNRKFKWFEYHRDAPVFKAGNLPPAQRTGGVIKVPDGTALKGIVKDKVLFVDGDYFRVVEVFKEGTFVCIRIVRPIDENEDGFFTNERMANDTELEQIAIRGAKVMYSSKQEGANDRNPVNRFVADEYNYTTIHEAWLKMSKEKLAELWYGKQDQRSWQLMHEVIEFAYGIERSVLLGQGGYNPNNSLGEYRHSTKGFINFNGIQLLEGVNPNNFGFMDFIERFCEDKVMKYNKKTQMTGFCNQSFLTWAAKLTQHDQAKAYLTMKASPDSKKFGIKIKELETPHVDIQLRQNTALTEHYGKTPVLVVADMDKISIRYLAGNGHNFSTYVERDVQPKGANYVEDKIYGAYGIQVKNAYCHSMLVLDGVA